MHESPYLSFFFFFNDTATTEIYTLSLHDALPISTRITGTAVIKKCSALARESGYTTGSTTSTRTASGCSRRNRRSTTRMSDRRRPIFRARIPINDCSHRRWRLSPAVHVRLNMEAAADHPRNGRVAQLAEQLTLNQ